MVQKKTGRPVQFEITEQARIAIGERLATIDTAGADTCSRAVSRSGRISQRGSMCESACKKGPCLGVIGSKRDPLTAGSR